MGIKTVFVLLPLAVVLLLAFASRPEANEHNARILYSHPLLLRAVSNISHTVLADFLWLASNSIDERSGRNAGVEELVAAARTIVVMDPYFDASRNYFATYLASIKRDVKGAVILYETARLFEPDSFPLLFNEMAMRVTYQEPLDHKRVVALAKEAIKLPERGEWIGDNDLSALVEGFMLYAADRGERREQMKKDLAWLLEHGASEERKEKIRQRLQAIE